MSISEYLKKSGTFILPGYFYAYKLSFYQWLRFLPLLQKSWWKKKCKDISLETIEYKCELDKYQILLIIQESPNRFIKSITMKPNILPKTLFHRFSPKFIKV